MQPDDDTLPGVLARPCPDCAQFARESDATCDALTRALDALGEIARTVRCATPADAARLRALVDAAVWGDARPCPACAALRARLDAVRALATAGVARCRDVERRLRTAPAAIDAAMERQAWQAVLAALDAGGATGGEGR